MGFGRLWPVLDTRQLHTWIYLKVELTKYIQVFIRKKFNSLNPVKVIDTHGKIPKAVLHNEILLLACTAEIEIS